MSWWQVLMLCWGCYMAGFATAALMAAARGYDELIREAQRSPGLTDD